ncbi:MAG: alpha/beta hydrolase [Bacteroidetes bacterium]|nr:MAG: alpha/beta hydrolase [Bacteroidota bacterium]
MKEKLIHEDFFTRIGKDDLFCRWIKHGSKSNYPVLIFLHEGLGSIPQWKDFPDEIALRTGLDVLLYERTGYGQSSPMTEQREIDYLHIEAEQLSTLVDHLAIPSYILIGHSEGGTIALIHAGENPAGLVKVITLSANVFHESKITKGILKVRQKFCEDNSKLRKALEGFHKNKTSQIFFAWSDTWTADWFGKFNVEESILRIKIGILAMHGNEDEYTSPEQIKRIEKCTKGPIRTFILNDCGHHPHFQQREKVLKYIVQFLSDVAPSKDR